MAITIRKMSCPYDCPSTCGLEAEIEDGRLIKVKNDKTHPVSKNGICRKMQHYEQDIYSMDRLMKPMRRVGKKGEGKFEPISWNEAVRETPFLTVWVRRSLSKHCVHRQKVPAMMRLWGKQDVLSRQS